jgi:integrase
MAGLPRIRYHYLYHAAASWKLNYGISPIGVPRPLGHSKASITPDIYSHLILGMQNKAAELIDDLNIPTILELHAK